jgi:hypothetical protein
MKKKNLFFNFLANGFQILITNNDMNLLKVSRFPIIS